MLGVFCILHSFAKNKIKNIIFVYFFNKVLAFSKKVYYNKYE